MDNTQFDIIIIGAGPAGSTAAWFLADAGLKVLVLEKEHFPRPHVGESLLPFCYSIFEKMGMLDLMKSRYHRKPGATFSNSDGSLQSHLCFSHVIHDESYLSFHVHRPEFDRDLLNHSRDAGATIQQGEKVEEVQFQPEKDRVIVNSNKGSYSCQFLVDASGRDTFLVNKHSGKKDFERVEKRIAFYSHWKGFNESSGLKEGNIKIVQTEGEKAGWIWLIPLGEDRLSIGTVTNLSFMRESKKAYEGETSKWAEHFYLFELNDSKELKAVIADAEMIEGVTAIPDYSYTSDLTYEDQYAVIGDAHAFLDPIFSSGVYMAMKSAELVASALIKKFKGASEDHLAEAFGNIKGAYHLIEELIFTYYDPGSISFNQVDELSHSEYNKKREAYSILHLILAGDFFENHEKYLNALKILHSKQNIEKYKHISGQTEHFEANKMCQ